MNNLNKILSHWKWVTLDDIGIVVSGGTPSTKEPEFWNGDIPWITPADLSRHEEIFVSAGSRNISQIGLDYSSAYLLPENSVVFSSRAPIGYVAIVKNRLATNQGFKNLILPSSSVSPKYVYYYLKTVKELAENMASGTTFLELSATKFKQIPFPLAPIEEQNRIVEKIEELFSELDKSNSELLRSRETTNKLIKKTIHSIFKEIRVWKSLSELAEITMGQSPSSSSFNTSGIGIPFFQGKKEFTKKYPVVEKYTTNPVRLAQKNDILMSVRAPVGNVNIANIDCAIGRGLCAIKFQGVNKFLFYYLNNIKRDLEQLGTGSTFDSISKSIIENIKIPYLESEQQLFLIDELESKIGIYENLINEINSQIDNNQTLKAKILAEAFCGKLINIFRVDLSIESVFEDIKKEKEEFFSKHAKNVKKRPKALKIKYNLKDIIDSKFAKIPFRFEDLIELNIFSLSQISEEWDQLLKEGYIKKSYNLESKQIQFKKV